VAPLLLPDLLPALGCHSLTVVWIASLLARATNGISHIQKNPTPDW
jgi:hypothetical protein